MIRTRFTEAFGLRYPVMSAPMALHSGGTLAAAVSAAGGMGSFGGLSAGGAEWLRAQARLVRERTDGPFAIGFITPLLDMSRDSFEAALEVRPDAIALSFSDPGDAGRLIKDRGIALICQVQRLDDVAPALDAGADVLVAQGTEAGGHTGEMGLLPLLTAIAERHPDVPLLAAGGIGSGRTLAAALVAGADGAWLGTAFLATPEAVEVAESQKTAIVESDGGDTVFTHTYDILSGVPWPEGIGVRVRRDAFTDEWGAREAELRSAPQGVAAGIPVYYGQSAGAVPGVRPAADVVHGICDEAERVLRSRAESLLGN